MRPQQNLTKHAGKVGFGSARSKKPRRRRWLGAEQLEYRRLLAGDLTASLVYDNGEHWEREYVDAAGNRVYAISLYEPESLDAVAASASEQGSPFPLSETFKLHSRPTATKVIYLDFDGHTTAGTLWNNSYGTMITPAYDNDGNVAVFGNGELELIQRVWQAVSEDFAPFDVDVTTEDPGVEALRNTGGGDDRWGGRVVVGPDTWHFGGAGGIAYIGSFDWDTDTPSFVFNSGEVGIIEAASHEVGHMLGLAHDGVNPGVTYYGGHGVGDTSWGPIMGAGYSVAVTHWSRGEYTGANQTQDDLSIITTQNGFSYRLDDHGDDIASATPLAQGGNLLAGEGIIERNIDSDYFSFTTLGGGINLGIIPAPYRPNLDILAELYDDAGNLLTSSNPVNSLEALLTADLAAGTYHVRVQGTGKANPDGYSNYGSLGQYSIRGLFGATTVAKAPFYEDWEQGFLAGYWEVIENDEGRVAVTTLHDPYAGNYHVTFDDHTVNGATSTNELILHIDLEGQTGVSLEFVNREFNDSDDPEDRVEISVDDGATWTPIVALTGANSTATSTVRSYDLDALGLTYSADTQIRFQQRSRHPLNFQVGGMAFDDIRVLLSGAPTDILLNPSSIAENTDTSAGNVAVGVLTAVDPSVGDTHTFTLLPVPLEDDLNYFELVGNELRVKQDVVLDFESRPSYRLLVQVNDGTNDFSKFLTITLTDVNEPPTSITLAPAAIAENTDTTAGDIAVGTLATIDPDNNNTFTYSLTAPSDVDNAAFVVVGDELRVKQNTALDFESKPSYQVQVQVNDGLNNYIETLTVNVADVNEPPTDVTVAPLSLVENTNTTAGDVLVGTFAAVDPDIGGTLTFSLVSGTGDTNNSSFRVVDDELWVRQNTLLDFETKSEFKILVEANDGALSLNKALTVQVTDVNEPPTGVALAPFSLAENTDTSAGDTLVGALAAIDPDVDNTFTYTLVSGPGDDDNGQFVIVGDQLAVKQGTLLDHESQASYQVLVQVNDGEYTMNQALVVLVDDVNEPPTALTLTPASIDENTDTTAGDVAVGTLAASDPDSDNTFSYSLIPGTGDDDNDLFVIDGDQLQLKQGTTVNFEVQSSYQVLVEVHDGANAFSQALAVTVTDLNEPPAGLALLPNPLAENTDTSAGDVAAGTLVAVDPDAGAVLTYSLVSGPGNGDNGLFVIAGNQLLVRAGVTLNFESRSSYDVRVRVSDGEHDLDQALAILVDDVNEPATELTLSPSALAENTDTTAGNVTVGALSNNDPDAGNTFVYTLVSGTGDADNDSFAIVGNQLQVKQGVTLDFESQASYQVRIQVDDGANVVAQELTVTVTDVNEAPTSIGLTPATIDENTDTTAGDTLVGTLSTVDPDAGNTLVYAFASGAGDDDNGAFVLVGNELRFQQNTILDFEAKSSYQVRVQVDDGANVVAQALVVQVADLNELPTASDDSAVLDEDTEVTIDVLGNDDDDGDALVVTGTTDPSNGSVVINADQTITYTPHENFSGTDEFTYTVSDGNGGQATATVVVTVDPLADDPTAGADIATTDEDVAAILDVLANDDDVDGDTLTIDATTDPANGSITVNADQTITYTPDEDFSGTDEFTYTISDGQGGQATATVTVTVDPVNDAPSADDDVATTDEDAAVTVQVLTNDDDVDGDTLSVTATSIPADGAVVINPDQTLTFTPNDDFHGAVEFTYIISDGQGGQATATVSVTVNAVNDDPAVNDDVENTSEDTPLVIDVLANDADADDDALSVTAPISVVGGSVVVNPDQTLTFTPEENFHGVVEFTYTVSDGQGGQATATVTVTVAPVNDAPEANDAAATTDEDTPVTIDVSPHVLDLDGDPLTISAGDGSQGVVVVQSDQSIIYTPAENFFGSDAFTYTVSDGQGGQATATVTVTINPVNDAPTEIVLDGDTVDENADGAPLGAVTASDPDTGDQLTLTVSDDRFEIVAGVLKLKAGVMLDFEIEPTVALQITATDNGSPVESLTQDFTVTVNDVAESLFAWQNALLRWDVDNNTVADLNDLRLLVLALKESNGPFPLPPLEPGEAPSAYLDVNGDNQVSIVDVHEVVLHLQAGLDGSGNGEGEADAGTARVAFDPIWGHGARDDDAALVNTAARAGANVVHVPAESESGGALFVAPPHSPENCDAEKPLSSLEEILDAIANDVDRAAGN